MPHFQTVSAQQIQEAPRDLRPHVVVLGAGASRAAFPNGDAHGHQLPLMDDLIEILELKPFLANTETDVDLGNFEAVLAQLSEKSENNHLIHKIERRINEYFSNLYLPDTATIYDQVLLSLRPKDAVLTFNWDPFLYDAYQRNLDTVSLPSIFFLHGNVRIGKCDKHVKWGPREGECPDCGNPLRSIPLLFPITRKDYSNNPYIRDSWTAAKWFFKNAFTLTIFGYGAPESDKDAIALLRTAWTARSSREMEHVEIIDIAPQPTLYSRWHSFTPTSHYQVRASFDLSRIARWPRRSCESLIPPMTQGIPCEDFPLPATSSLADLQAYIQQIARYE